MNVRVQWTGSCRSLPISPHFLGTAIGRFMDVFSHGLQGWLGTGDLGLGPLFPLPSRINTSDLAPAGSPSGPLLFLGPGEKRFMVPAALPGRGFPGNAIITTMITVAHGPARRDLQERPTRSLNIVSVTVSIP